MPARPTPYRLLAVGAVGALHLLVLLLWPARPTGRVQPAQDQAPLVVQLLTAPAIRPAPPRDPLPDLRRPAAPMLSWRPPALAVPTVALPVVEPPVGLPADAASPTGASHAAPPVSGILPAPSTPLDLTLPPAAARRPASPRPPDTPRPRSVEQRLAQGLASAPLREEARGDGRVRLRKGQGCVDLRDARMAQIDPFNQSVNPIPKQAEDCAR